MDFLLVSTETAKKLRRFEYPQNHPMQKKLKSLAIEQSKKLDEYLKNIKHER